MPSASYDTIIIGAGMSGLAAGIRLAQFDQRVLILEKHYLWGGLNSFYKQAGRRFDVGLHALTNYVPKGTRGTPLIKLLRQLRLRYDDLNLRPQGHSAIRFPDCSLVFTNEFARFEQEVVERFPSQRDGFARLVAAITEYDAFNPPDTNIGAREILAEYLSDQLLIEMLLCPLSFYGSAREGDVDWYQFVILFRSIFQEGFARPEGGIKPLLDLLIARYKELGGELRMRTGVSEILHEDGHCSGVRLMDGTEISATRVLSSVGWAETLKLAGPELYAEHANPDEIGTLSFTESIFVMNKEPRDLGFDSTIVFFNDSETFDYKSPTSLIDPRSGVIACPNNYLSDAPLKEGIYRLTTLANYEAWKGLNKDEYAAAKESSMAEALEVSNRYGIDPRPHTVHLDSFTPCTVERFTDKMRGAVYGATKKRLDGNTPLANLHIIGTDQGLLGVTGSMLSGISIANRYALVPQ
ncbi:MAG: phytoene dehydrogenase-like protein [Planctomycetota bacterium]|jgi:phytoene dehydrogenase-like protein